VVVVVVVWCGVVWCGDGRSSSSSSIGLVVIVVVAAVENLSTGQCNLPFKVVRNVHST